MNRSEEERLSRLLYSVEREERMEEERIENPSTVRRQLFRDVPPVEPVEEPDSDDEQKDHVEVQEEDTESEQSGDEEELPRHVGPVYTGKDEATHWNVHCPPPNRRTAAHNLVRLLPGVRPHLVLESPLAAWKLFFTEDILNNILRYTNQRIDKIRPRFSRARDASSAGSTLYLLVKTAP